jgi:phosphonoacetaldehyde hydrolase
MVMNDPRGRIRAVIFDWAGTTVDHGSLAPVAPFVEAFRKGGVAITTAEARGPMGVAKRDHIAAILAMPRVAAAWREDHGHGPVEADVDRLFADFLPLQHEALSRHADVIPGVPGIVAECRRRGIKIGVNTGYSRALMDVAAPLARGGGFDPDVIICNDDVPRGRPAPWMIFRALERLDAFPVSRVVVVDDTPVGVAAGLHAGARVVAVTRTGNALGLSSEEVQALDPADLAARLAPIADAFRRQGAHAVIESVADLVPVLDRFEAEG